MRSRDLTCCGMFGPHALAVMGAAFDQAWAEVETYFLGTLSREVGRLILASAVLGNATESRDIDELKWRAMRKLVQIGYLPTTIILPETTEGHHREPGTGGALSG